MISISRVFVVTALLVGSTAFAVAQQSPGQNTKDPAGSEAAKPTGGKSDASPSAPSAPAPAAAPTDNTGVGSRPIGPPAGTDKDAKKSIEQQDKKKGN